MERRASLNNLPAFSWLKSHGMQQRPSVDIAEDAKEQASIAIEDLERAEDRLYKQSEVFWFLKKESELLYLVD